MSDDLQLRLLEGLCAVGFASMSLTRAQLAIIVRDDTRPAANPLNREEQHEQDRSTRAA